ncbi:MAG: hypothetical protein HY263_02175, partial [Chloroflexi bacterium]|nr:hypothetical protein [Chloroflexota bacterium]
MTEMTQPLPLAGGAEPSVAGRIAGVRGLALEQLAMPALAVLSGVLYLVNLTV